MVLCSAASCVSLCFLAGARPRCFPKFTNPNTNNYRKIITYKNKNNATNPVRTYRTHIPNLSSPSSTTSFKEPYAPPLSIPQFHSSRPLPTPVAHLGVVADNLQGFLALCAVSLDVHNAFSRGLAHALLRSHADLRTGSGLRRPPGPKTRKATEAKTVQQLTQLRNTYTSTFNTYQRNSRNTKTSLNHPSPPAPLICP